MKRTADLRPRQCIAVPLPHSVTQHAPEACAVWALLAAVGHTERKSVKVEIYIRALRTDCHFLFVLGLLHCHVLKVLLIQIPTPETVLAMPAPLCVEVLWALPSLHFGSVTGLAA